MIHVTVIKNMNNVVHVHCRVVIRGFPISVHTVQFISNDIISVFDA